MEDQSKYVKIIKNSQLIAASIFAMASLSACQYSSTLTPIPNINDGNSPSDPTAPTVTPTPTPTPLVTHPPSNEDTHTGGLKVVFKQKSNFTASGYSLLESARAALEKVVNTEEFKQRILGAMYTNTNGFTNLQIYNLIMAGAEQYPSVTDANQTMDLYVERYTSSWFGRNTVGYTMPSTSTIFMNSYFFDYADVGGVAGNMMHEWLHKLGFDHSSASDVNSVPYSIGYLAEDLAKP